MVGGRIWAGWIYRERQERQKNQWVLPTGSIICWIVIVYSLTWQCTGWFVQQKVQKGSLQFLAMLVSRPSTSQIPACNREWIGHDRPNNWFVQTPSNEEMSGKQDLDEEPTFVLDEGRTDCFQLHSLASLFLPGHGLWLLFERIQTLIGHIGHPYIPYVPDSYTTLLYFAWPLACFHEEARKRNHSSVSFQESVWKLRRQLRTFCPQPSLSSTVRVFENKFGPSHPVSLFQRRNAVRWRPGGSSRRAAPCLWSIQTMDNGSSMIINASYSRWCILWSGVIGGFGMLLHGGIECSWLFWGWLKDLVLGVIEMCWHHLASICFLKYAKIYWNMLNSNWKWFLFDVYIGVLRLRGHLKPFKVPLWFVVSCEHVWPRMGQMCGWWVAEKRESSSIRPLGISESQSLLALYVAYCFTFFLGQPLNRRSSAIYNVAWDFRSDLFTNLLSQKRTWNASNLTMSKPCSAKTSERSGQW